MSTAKGYMGSYLLLMDVNMIDVIVVMSNDDAIYAQLCERVREARKDNLNPYGALSCFVRTIIDRNNDKSTRQSDERYVILEPQSISTNTTEAQEDSNTDFNANKSSDGGTN